VKRARWYRLPACHPRGKDEGMKKNFWCVALLAVMCWPASAAFAAEPPTRRAVVVGINNYELPGQPQVGKRRWRNLSGAVNDAETIRSLLVGRLGFRDQDVKLLTNEQAKREAILSTIQSHLIEPSRPGDIAVFFYSGHGSQVVNSLSNEPDKRDESLVPADSAQGALDIRDKELAVLFNKILAQKASLTVIFDSCHSGSVARGEDVARVLELDTRDAADPANPPAPEEGGAIVLSASQDDESSWEYWDDTIGAKRGRFTYALQRALLAPTPGEPVQRLFMRVQALMKSSGGPVQTPVLGGKPDLLRQPLFGASPQAGAYTTSVAVLEVKEGQATLQGGKALGLTPGSELVPVGKRKGPRLKITSVEGLTRSKAMVMEPLPLKPGDLFEVALWMTPAHPHLKIWTAPLRVKPEELLRASELVRAAVAMRGAIWVAEPSRESPTHVFAFNGREWTLNALQQDMTQSLGGALDAGPVAQALANLKVGKTAKVFLALPPPRELDAGLELGPGTPAAVIARSTARDADYLLVGRASRGRLSYAWVRPFAEWGAETPLPVETQGFEFTKDVKSSTRELLMLALRLGRINAWLQLESPLDARPYPYELAIQTREGGLVQAGTLESGHDYQLALRAVGDKPPDPVSPRFVYVFIIDSSGKAKLLFPSPNLGLVENRFPPKPQMDTPQASYLIGPGFRVVPPLGIDTYVLLTSDEQLPDPGILESPELGARKGKPSPLEKLLSRIGETARSAEVPVPQTWSIQRLTTRSIPPPPAGGKPGK
jgi:hypothetical protein